MPKRDFTGYNQYVKDSSGNKKVDVDFCAKLCWVMNFPYFGLEYGQDCLCDSNFGGKVTVLSITK